MCNKQGIINKWFLNDCNLDKDIDNLHQLLPQDSNEILQMLEQTGMILGYKLKSLSLFSSGGQYKNGFLVAVAQTSDLANELYNDELRKMATKATQTTFSVDPISSKYEELSALNNELVNMQRKVAQKNRQLHHTNQVLEQKNQEIKTLNRELQSTVIELQNTKDELIQNAKMASLGRLVMGFAHEINTPVGIALTAVTKLAEIGKDIEQMLAREEVKEEDLEAALRKISQASQLATSNLLRTGQLVASFKRTSIEQNIEEKKLFCVRDVVQDVIISLQSKFRGSQVKIENFCDAQINIYGYPGIISQIITNCLLNSLLHGFDNGKLCGKISIEIAKDEKKYELIYRDNGRGMDEQVVKKVFEPFFTTKRAKGGTGLGMYICYNLVVDKLHGSLLCESVLGKGVVFRTIFPYKTIPIKAAKDE